MGQSIDRTEFSAEDYQRFSSKLHENLKALNRAIALPNFGSGEAAIGAELELYLIDENSQPVYRNQELHAQFNDPQLTLELNRFNLEYNLTPVKLSDSPFKKLEQQMVERLQALNQIDSSVGMIPVGILPTLEKSHFGMHAMTDEQRYHFLNKILQNWHDGPFKVNISGPEPVSVTQNDITLEGGCTSFQLHYQVEPERFGRLWNITQLVTPVVLALSANSPFLLGQRCWMESRIPLFKQSIDGRRERGGFWREQPRVCFGQGWLRNNPVEIFAENVHIYPALIPLCSDETPLAKIEQGEVPELNELNLHNGTVWTWNRPIYSAADGGHLRIEVRSLPAGPTPADMIASSAFMIGLMEGLEDEIDWLMMALPFGYAEYNFYRAAQYGMDARLIWPQHKQNGLQESSLDMIVGSLLYKAEKGLQKIGISSQEARYYLDNINSRIDTGMNGARWQQREFEHHLLHCSRADALSKMVQQYRQLSLSNLPVTQWPIR